VYEYHVFPQRTKLKRNAYCAIACGHLCAFRITHNQAHQIGSRLNVKLDFRVNPERLSRVDGGCRAISSRRFFLRR